LPMFGMHTAPSSIPPLYTRRHVEGVVSGPSALPNPMPNSARIIASAENAKHGLAG
jgi:hypothetical protein